MSWCVMRFLMLVWGMMEIMLTFYGSQGDWLALHVYARCRFTCVDMYMLVVAFVKA